MARVALTIAGTALGTQIGMPGLGAMLGGALGGYLEPSKTVTREGPRIDDMHVQISSYGAAIPRVWGTMRLAGNVIWAAPIEETVTNDEVSEGKGGPTVVQVKYSYYGTFAVALCAGPVDRLIRIWADSKLIYSVVPTNEQIVGIPGLNFRLHLGDETQTPDSWIESYEGAGNVPGHRGMCYVVFNSFPLERFGNRIPNFSFDVTTQGVDDVSYHEFKIGVDPSAWTEDHLVFASDGVNLITSQEGRWARVNTVNNTLYQSARHDGQSPGDRHIPARLSGSPTVTVNFDVDERGVIHTIEEIVDVGAKLCQLDGTTLALTREGSWITVETFRYLRVSQNPSYPFIVAFDTESRSKLYIIHRDDHNIIDSTDGNAVGDDLFWRSADIDHNNGVVYALKVHTGAGTPAYDGVVKIVLNTDGTIASINPGSVPLQVWTDDDCPDADEVVFDPESNQVVVGSTGQNKMAFYDPETPFDTLGVMTATLTAGRMKSAWRRGAQNGYLYHAVHSPDSIQRIDVSAHSSDQAWTLDDSAVAWDGGSCYDPLTHSVIVGAEVDGNPKFIKVFLDRSGSTKIELSTLVEGVCESVGLDPATELDVAGLTDLVYGFVVNDTMQARAALQALMDAFFFDAVESDGLLKFVKRGGSVVADVPETDLGAHVAGGTPPQRLVTTRAQELDLPYEIDVIYIDPTANYVAGVQRERRLMTSGRSIVKMRVPVVLEPDVAKQVCAKHLALAWTARTTHQFELSRKYAYLEPGDVITVTEDSLQHTLRVQQIDFVGPTLTVRAADEDAMVYESEAEGTTIETEDEDVEFPGATYMSIVDGPPSETAGVYLATTGYTIKWQGAVVVKSQPLGAI